MHSIKQIGKRFWYSTPISDTDRPVLGMVVGSGKALMIDAGNSESHANYFFKELQERGVPHPDIVILTHSHWDHIFGLPALGETLIVSSRETKEEMVKLQPLSWSDEAIDERVHKGIEIEFCAAAIKKEYLDERNISIVLPDVLFEERLEMNLGDVTCIIEKVGGSHASDSVVVYVKEEKILFLGDAIYCRMYAEKWHYKIDETLQLLDKLEAFDAETYILSHTGVLSKEEFQQETSMLRTIAHLTERYNGEKEKIVKKYKEQLQREVSEGEMDTIEQFVNGY
ncbi:MBL fold metallo-hydrolase [Lysinibacillus odysseyi]|uniref:Zn-dependent hydrolase n=1 Tax=Lysinibacillus odysseyi 34hs-1 = NBRC 100172 TaxID=1220589 RepID=A0A0A3JBX7_9BACI|nr:MBL fold metallo-hydrolase [Lysinibacillus odysseyi]KGR84532.1 Zn-dependent hydrolase [Lysinibacillus odysseyi 34hs-1 = NBRC 100172]